MSPDRHSRMSWMPWDIRSSELRTGLLWPTWLVAWLGRLVSSARCLASGAGHGVTAP